MRVIGVTGGVGAGKSTALNFLEQKYGAKLILADVVGHEVMEPGEEVHEKILQTFGRGILDREGRIDRKALGDLVFAKEEQRMKLNAIVHPAVKKEILRRIAREREAGTACVAVEAALFLEENYDVFCDETWYIYTDEERRRERLRASRGYSDQRIDQMLQSQKTDAEFRKRCTLVLDNNGTEEETHRQIDERMRD